MALIAAETWVLVLATLTYMLRVVQTLERVTNAFSQFNERQWIWHN